MSEPIQPAPPPQWQPPAGPTGPRAGFGQRLGAYLIDFFLIGIVGVLVVVVIALVDDSLFGLGYAFWFVAFLAYSVYFTGGPTGQTVGKRIVGIRVIDFRTGGAIGYGRGVIRYLGQIVSSWICYLGYFWMLWDREKQCWHDKMATTVVVPEQYYPVERWP